MSSNLLFPDSPYGQRCFLETLFDHLLIHCETIPSGLLNMIMAFLDKIKKTCCFLGHSSCRVAGVQYKITVGAE